MKTVLSIDGGGVRGIIPTRVLAALQRRLPLPVGDYFDLIAGTSSGAITALSLARPDPIPPEAITAQFIALAPQMFSAPWTHRLTHLNGLLGPKYSERRLEAVFHQGFGTLRLSHLRCPVIVPALDVCRRRAKLFCRPQDDAAVGRDYLLAEVLRATTAAPSYFRPAELAPAVPTGLVDDAAPEVFVDGGLFANNPAIHALACLERGRGWFGPNHQALLLSLGTGTPTRQFPHLQARDWGLLQWISPVIQFMGLGLDTAIDQAVEQGFESDLCYRMQIPLGRGAHDRTAPKDELDTTSAENLALLVAWGDRLATQQAEHLDALAARLIKAGPKR